MRGQERGIHQIGEAIDKITPKIRVSDQPAQEEGRGVVVMAVERTARGKISREHVELPGRGNGPEAAPAHIVIKLQPPPPARRGVWPPEAMISNIPAVI